jgi:hypothetical protein
MTPAERTAKIAELRAEADRLEREANAKENAKNGDLFRSYGNVVLIPPSYPNTYAIALTGESIGCQCYKWEKDPNLEYLGHARDLLTIKTPDATEPTGAQLVGKDVHVCDVVNGAWCTESCGAPIIVVEHNPDSTLPYTVQSGNHWRFARLAKDRP